MVKTPLKGGDKLYLRCTISKSGGKYIGTCLELSLVVRSNSIKECKNELTQLVHDYIETVTECLSKGEKVKLMAVRNYWIKKVIFNLKLALSDHTRTKQPPNIFTKEVVLSAM